MASNAKRVSLKKIQSRKGTTHAIIMTHLLSDDTFVVYVMLPLLSVKREMLLDPVDPPPTPQLDPRHVTKINTPFF